MTDVQTLLAGMVRYTPVEGEDLDMVPDAVGAYVRYDAMLALVAAAYADAADGLDAGADEYSCGHDARYCTCHNNIDQMRIDADIVREGTPTDATAALARMLAEARAEGLADLLMVERMDDVSAVCREYRIKEPSFRAALRALAGSDAP